MIFCDRFDAGGRLADRLKEYANRPDVVVLALPRGGVPVGAMIARELDVPLDVFVVRKIGVPGHPELAMGAIASGGVVSLNQDVLRHLPITRSMFEEVMKHERQELTRREHAYRDDLPPPDVLEKTVIVVDDGVATGSTMIAAIAALRELEAKEVIAVAPVIAASTFDAIRNAADKVFALDVPDEFHGVGSFYQDFSQTTDEEVRGLLGHANNREQGTAAVPAFS